MKKLNDREIGQMRVMTGLELYLQGSTKDPNTDFFEIFTHGLTERIANIVRDKHKVFYLGRDCSNVLNAASHLLNDMGFNKVINDRECIMDLIQNSFNSKVVKFSIPSFNDVLNRCNEKIPYIQIKMAYLVYLIALIGILDSSKQITIITRTRTDASVLFDVLSTLELGKLITFEQTGFSIGQAQNNENINPYLNISKTIKLHYEKENNLEVELQNIGSDDILLRAIDSKTVVAETPVERFVSQSISNNLASIDVRPIEIFNRKGNLEKLLNILIRSKFFIYSDKKRANMLDKKLVFISKGVDVAESYEMVKAIRTVLDELTIPNESIEMVSDIMKNIIHVEHRSDSYNLYYEQLQQYANKEDNYAILIDADGIITFCGPEESRPCKIPELKSFEERVEEKLKEEQEKELTPERVQFICNLRSLLRD